jgi:hypothetical protein
MGAMWLYLIAAVLVILGLIGGIFAGGIFTIVLVPLGAIVVVTAVGSAMWGRAAQGSAGGGTDASGSEGSTLPRSRSRESGRQLSSPERLADTRRQQQ